MNEHAKSLIKPIALSAISSYCLETVQVVDKLTLEGRADTLQALPERPGGLCVHALGGVRIFDTDAKLAIGSRAGELDYEAAVAPLRASGVETKYLLRSGGKHTNRSEVIIDRHDQKLIIRRRRGVQLVDLDIKERRPWLGMIAQSTACVLGNLPLDLSEHFIDFGRHVGTYVTLAPGERVLGSLAHLAPHALCLNFGEARQATGRSSDDDAVVFKRLLDATTAEHVVVMTGGAKRPIRIADRLSGHEWQIDPVDVNVVPEHNGYVNSLGAGDIFAGVLTFLLGMPRRLIAGEAVFEAARFAHEVVTAHLTGSSWAERHVHAQYPAVRGLFEPTTIVTSKPPEAA